MTVDTVNPSDGSTIASYEEDTPERVQERLSAARSCFGDWKQLTYAERSVYVTALGEQLDRRQGELAELMATEMGKPVHAGRAEVDKCAVTTRHYATTAAQYLADVQIETDRSSSFVHHTPLGTILAVMPWNFPFWQVLRFAAPALMAGNTCVLKHALNVTGCALAIEELFADAGFPEGAFSTLVVPSSRIADVIAAPEIAAVTLTGSEAAGSSVASIAGKHLKKSVLELGGSDPYVVLADADLDLAATTAVRSRLTNTGQSCVAAKRFIAVAEVYDEFCERVIDLMGQRVTGDPHDPDTTLGPMARTDLRDELHDQVERAVSAGATLALGGAVPNRPGAWYDPTVLVGVDANNPAHREETFGPVAAVMKATDTDDAIALANDSEFGLGAAVFTQDLDLGAEIASNRLDAGTCCVNTMVISDARLPFGGIKKSGYGRELADLGIKEFVNAKTVAIS